MKRFFYFMLPLLALAISCTEETPEEIIEQPIATLRISGVVTEVGTGLPIDSAKVELLGDETTGKTVYTDENGFFSFGIYNTGTYLIKYMKNNYLNEVRSISAMNYDMTIAQEQTITMSTALTPLSETLTTQIRYRFEGAEISFPLTDAPFSINLGEYNDPITGTTDSEGNITINNLPKNDWLYINMDFEKDGYTYYLNYGFNLPGDKLPAIITLTPSLEPVLFFLTAANVLDNKGYGVDDFNPNSDITLEFSAAVDTNNYYFNIDYSWNYTYIENIAWSNNNKTVILTINGMEYNSNYSIYYNVDAESSSAYPYYLNNTIYFSTEEL